MFKNTFQSGQFSILYSIGSKPLQNWDRKNNKRKHAHGRVKAIQETIEMRLHVQNGHIKRVVDDDIKSQVIQIIGSNVSTIYLKSPTDQFKTLGVKLPFLVLIVKNMKKYFSFEVTVLDDKNVRRRFRASNYQSATKVKAFECTMPMKLDEGWNQIQFNLSDFTNRAYGTSYVETISIQIHANCRVRRVYFCDRLYTEDELPDDFKLYLPVQNRTSSAYQSIQQQQS